MDLGWNRIRFRVPGGFPRGLAAIALALLSATGWSQEVVPTLRGHAGYFGNNLWNPGLDAGLEYTFRREEHVTRKGREQIRQRFYNLDAGFSMDPGSHTGVFLHAGLNRRTDRDGKLHVQFGGSPLGIYRSFLPETYAYTAEEGVSRVRMPGRLYYAPVFRMGIGKPWPHAAESGWYLGADLTGLLPYNSSVMMLINLRMGLTFPVPLPN
ncbi:MAG: hypothetical protein R2751_17490 [Bacteroidales bacterium]